MLGKNVVEIVDSFMLTPEQIAAIAAGFGIPKLLVKLIDVTQQGVGKATESYFIRKKLEAEADGEAYRIKKLAEAMTNNDEIVSSLEFKGGQLVLRGKENLSIDLSERSQRRFEYQQAQKQFNVENVTREAVDELLNDPELETNENDDSISLDWINKFFSSVEDVSDELMQQLWAKILVGEIKRPTTFSIRTLDFLRVLSKHEAEAFLRLARYACKYKGTYYLLEDSKLMPEVYLLTDIGVLAPEERHLNFDYKIFLEYMGNAIWLNHFRGISGKHRVFTRVGADLMKLVLPTYEVTLFNEIARNCAPRSTSVSRVFRYEKISSYDQDGNAVVNGSNPFLTEPDELWPDRI